MLTPADIAATLLQVEAVKLRTDPPFTWSSGLKSPIYCDNRALLSFPAERRIIIDGYKQLIAEHFPDFDVLAGTATAGIPWASFLALELNKPLVYVRSQAKAHGLEKLVEGRMVKGSRVLIIEDLISTGGSALAASAACQREAEAHVVGVVAIFTYEMKKAQDAFLEAKIPLYAQGNFSTLLQIAEEKKAITTEQRQLISVWSTSPETWMV
jgi:orotate phosphoribosyltransferase